MAVFRYEGEADVREVWGTSFPYGKTVEVDDEALIRKVMGLSGFVRVDVAEPVPEPEAPPPADDYVAEETQEAAFPQVGSGLVPEGWETAHWKTKVKLAKDLTGKDCANAAEAEAAIREALEAK